VVEGRQLHQLHTKIEGLLDATGANLMYAGYPYDPFAPDAPTS
jgi:hypothetical protein